MIGVVIDIVLIIGAMKMRRMESYLFSVIVSGPRCGSVHFALLHLRTALRHLALVVLNDPSVKAAFRS